MKLFHLKLELNSHAAVDMYLQAGVNPFMAMNAHKKNCITVGVMALFSINDNTETII